MKNIRLGNDISIKWYVYRMNSPEDFNNKTVDVYLLDKNDVKQNFSYKIEDGLINGVFYGKNQITTGSYRLVLVENAGNNNMVTLDYVDAFVLNSKMHNTTSSGSDTVCNMKTQIVNLTSIMSSKTGATNLYDYYTREEVDEILNGYAAKHHAHDEYAKTTDLESYATKDELPDTSNFATKDELPSEYDDTTIRNLIGTKQDKLTDQQIANLNADHSKYLTEHQTLPDYSNTYAPVNHTHNQYLESESDPTVPAYVKSIKQTDIDAWNAATGGIDLSDYVTKTDLDAASYITADQVTHPDYSNTYAPLEHTHSQYALKTELFSKDYNDLSNKPTIPEEYDDTAVRNLIGTKQDKLTTQQIANLNADHSKYLTQHQTLPDYSNTYAPVNHTHNQYLESESDPTVPAYVKSIKQTDIDAWNAATGGIDLSDYVTKTDLDAASYITASQVTHPDYSTTYAKLEHTHSQYLTQHQTLPDYSNTYAGISHTHAEYAGVAHTHSQYAYKDHTHSNYALKTELFSKDYNDLTNKPTIPEEYDDTAVRNLIDTKQNKLSEQQIANLNADHSKYITKHQTLPDYSTTYAPLEHTHSQYLTQHQTLPDYSNTYAGISHTHNQYALKTELPDTSNFATISYLNEKLGSIDAALTNILEG